MSKVHTLINESFPFPQPPTNPIPVLAGHGYAEVAPGSKCTSQGFDETFTRTGD